MASREAAAARVQEERSRRRESEERAAHEAETLGSFEEGRAQQVRADSDPASIPAVPPSCPAPFPL